MPDPCGDFHEYSMSSIPAASRRWAERITIFLGQWLLCAVRLSVPLPPLAGFHEYNVFLTSLSGAVQETPSISRSQGLRGSRASHYGRAKHSGRLDGGGRLQQERGEVERRAGALKIDAHSLGDTTLRGKNFLFQKALAGRMPKPLTQQIPISPTTGMKLPQSLRASNHTRPYNGCCYLQTTTRTMLLGRKPSFLYTPEKSVVPYLEQNTPVQSKCRPAHLQQNSLISLKALSFNEPRYLPATLVSCLSQDRLGQCPQHLGVLRPFSESLITLYQRYKTQP